MFCFKLPRNNHMFICRGETFYCSKHAKKNFLHDQGLNPTTPFWSSGAQSIQRLVRVFFQCFCQLFNNISTHVLHLVICNLSCCAHKFVCIYVFFCRLFSGDDKQFENGIPRNVRTDIRQDLFEKFGRFQRFFPRTRTLLQKGDDTTFRKYGHFLRDPVPKNVHRDQRSVYFRRQILDLRR